MDFLEELFETSKIIPLKKKSNLKYELEYQRKLIIDNGFEIINTFENKDSILILYRHFFEDIPKKDEPTITLSLRIITKRGVRYPEPIIRAFFNDTFSKINLADIDIKENMSNKGYGSILLSNLINIAKEKNVSIISGWISRVDINHIERLLHFYQKHGFEVIMDKTQNIGDLVWVNN